MEKFKIWTWFGLAIAALAAAVVAKGLAALFVLLAVAFVVAGIYFALRN